MTSVSLCFRFSPLNPVVSAQKAPKLKFKVLAEQLSLPWFLENKIQASEILLHKKCIFPKVLGLCRIQLEIRPVGKLHSTVMRTQWSDCSTNDPHWFLLRKQHRKAYPWITLILRGRGRSTTQQICSPTAKKSFPPKQMCLWWLNNHEVPNEVLFIRSLVTGSVLGGLYCKVKKDTVGRVFEWQACILWSSV